MIKSKSIIKNLKILIWIIAITGCASPIYNLPVIHPEVFSMIRCLWSDTMEPVVSEINLDAVRANRNQFDYDAVTEREGWVYYSDEDSKGFMRYRVIKKKGNSYLVQFHDNGGGTLTMDSEIGFTLLHRNIVSDSKTRKILVLRVDSVK